MSSHDSINKEKSVGRFMIGGNGSQIPSLVGNSAGPSLPVQGSVRPVPTVAPNGISAPPTARQLVIIPCDGSPSTNEMDSSGTRTKAESISQATASVIEALRGSSLKSNFAIAWIPWAERVLSSLGPQAVVNVPVGQDWNPARFGGRGTRSAVALAEAAPMARAYMDAAMREGLPASVVVLLLTDGKDGAPAEALDAARELRSIEGVTLAACRFGASDDGDDLLRRMADEGLYQEVHNADEIRRFFMESVTAAGQKQISPEGRN